MTMRVPFGLLTGLLLLTSLSGCSVWRSATETALPPPTLTRQARVLQVPDDLRLPRVPMLAPPQTQPMNAQAFAMGGAVPQAMPLPAPTPAPAARPPEPERMLFAPYMPTSKESQVPETWVQDPSYDFPWIAGAQPSRVNEETTLGVGTRMFGRMFAKVEFGSTTNAPPVPPMPEPVAMGVKKPAEGNFISRLFKSKPIPLEPVAEPVVKPTPLSAANVRCDGATCLDKARDMLLQDAERKGWRVLLNRRVSMHQSFQFQREDRVIWVEVNAPGKKQLQIEYNLLPLQ